MPLQDNSEHLSQHSIKSLDHKRDQDYAAGSSFTMGIPLVCCKGNHRGKRTLLSRLIAVIGVQGDRVPLSMRPWNKLVPVAPVNQLGHALVRIISELSCRKFPSNFGGPSFSTDSVYRHRDPILDLTLIFYKADADESKKEVMIYAFVDSCMDYLPIIMSL